ncbi:Glutamate-gated kainate-type ion channel receptor subunit GluR5 [Handroanthus impetiginosus]|uniref:Glutamate-gated kainate-type ion channel receptor subunit GluR5 n=1 Tax=Handroanthus impetiginosus TaxID=429701 RepID=A0A2G9HNU0_9LAMI|nr:Glutamate-gated kainate-type ion channel receptor subunit GluR5 [Handroanthus impetiginosus]
MRIIFGCGYYYIHIRNFRDEKAFGVWAYNAAWALAEAIESAGMKHSQNWAEGAGLKLLGLGRLRVSNTGSAILSKITSSQFREFGGQFQLQDIYEILNVIGRRERRVGFWNSAYGLTKELVNLYHDQQNNKTTFGGFCIDVFQASVDRLRYEISFKYIFFYNHYGSYSDLVYQVYLENYDAAVGDVTLILSNRSKYVDFTLPYTESGLDPWFFLKPLQPDLWVRSACFFFLTGFIVWLVEHPINEEFQGPPAQQIETVLWFAASTLVYAHKRVQGNVSRFVVSVWLFVVLILTSSYIAKLSLLLTVEQIKLTKSDYVGYYSRNSFIQAMGVSNLDLKDNGLKPFQQGRKKGGVDGIVDEVPYLKIFVARYPHDYTMIGSSMLTSGFCFAFPRGSTLVHDISRAIVELREEGTLVQIEKKWFSSQSSPLPEDTEPPSNPDTLSSDKFFGLFLLSGISKSIAILIFVIFLLHEKLSTNYYMITVLARGKLILILRYLYPRMVNIIDEEDAR